jgi:dUTP pyrophosphatase
MTYTLQILPTTNDVASYYQTAERNNDNAGFDLYVPEETVFAPNEKKLVSMNVKATVTNIHDKTVHYWMLPRSSISKTGLMLCNSVGVIDRTYRGELMAFLWNTKSEPVTVSKGSRLVQIVAPDMGWIHHVELVQTLDTTERGEGGFGSTGR